MDTHVLALLDISFLLLYTTITLIYRTTHYDVQPGVRGTDWFLASILSLVIVRALTLLPQGRTVELMLIVFVLGAYLLQHRAFAELLERGRALWGLQAGIVAVALAAAAGAWLIGDLTFDLKLLSLIVGLQFGVTSAMLLGKSAHEGGTARRFAGIATGMFSVCHVLWFCKMEWPAGVLNHVPGRVPPVIWLVAHGAIAFAFLMVASSRLSQRLSREAGVDELTGMMNRRAIRQAAMKALAQCRRSGQLSVVAFDLDGFKDVNDRLGHEAGDSLLRTVSQDLQETVRKGDTLARMGGDEFCLLLPDANEREAVQAAERCRRAILKLAIPYDGEQLRMSASFGVAHSADREMDWEELLRRSDAAMYKAKRHGGNRVVVAPSVGAAARLAIEDIEEKRNRLQYAAAEALRIAYRDATGSSMRSSASATSFWTKGSA